MSARPAGAPRAGDVWFLTVDLGPRTTCYPPDGQSCYLASGASWMRAADARRHALENPGHEVVRERISRTTYQLDPQRDAP